ncbi:MAG: GxxExxY protein [Verrucomicrobiota bacterium]
MDAKIKSLCDEIRQVSYDLHHYLGHGHLEKVYENGLCHRLSKAGLSVESQVPLDVFDEDGVLLGHYVADLVIEDLIIVEIKAVSRLRDEHCAQLLGYLKALKIEHGLLINFGAYRFEIKKFVFSKKPHINHLGSLSSFAA